MQFTFDFKPDLSYRILMSLVDGPVWLSGSGGTQSARAVWNLGIDALPGSTPDAPLLPIETDGDTFVIPVPVQDASRTTYVDPVSALGYDYASDRVNLRSVTIPNALPGGSRVRVALR